MVSIEAASRRMVTASSRVRAVQPRGYPNCANRIPSMPQRQPQERGGQRTEGNFAVLTQNLAEEVAGEGERSLLADSHGQRRLDSGERGRGPCQRLTRAGLKDRARAQLRARAHREDFVAGTNRRIRNRCERRGFTESTSARARDLQGQTKGTVLPRGAHGWLNTDAGRDPARHSEGDRQGRGIALQESLAPGVLDGDRM